MKVAVIGGGSSYTPELVKGFLDRADSFPMTELWLVDVLPERLEVVGGFAQRMAAAAGSPFTVHLTTDRRAGVAGADYVTTQLRVGWMAARKNDEYLGLRHGLIGQETTGVGGMAKALRTIPVILGIAADMRELAPGALLVNFTNPAGLVTEALARHAADVPSVGVCNVPITARMMMAEMLAKRTGQPIDPNRTRLDTLGLNHLSWHRGFEVDGEDVWAEIIAGTLDDLAGRRPPGLGSGADRAVADDPQLLSQLLLPNGQKAGRARNAGPQRVPGPNRSWPSRRICWPNTPTPTAPPRRMI